MTSTRCLFRAACMPGSLPALLLRLLPVVLLPWVAASGCSFEPLSFSAPDCAASTPGLEILGNGRCPGSRDAGSLVVQDASGPAAVDSGAARDAATGSTPDTGATVDAWVSDSGAGDGGPTDLGTSLPAEDAETSTPTDAGQDIGLDASPDAGQDSGPVICVPETDAALCQRLGAQCGVVSGLDNCGIMRALVACSTCPLGAWCNAANLCECTSEPPETLCARTGRVCGTTTGTDNCGRTVTANCGMCPNGRSCTAGGQCACQPQCAGRCGGSDGCGGTCPAVCPSGERCNINQRCECAPETDEELCAMDGIMCGENEVTDRCGEERDIDCKGSGCNETLTSCEQRSNGEWCCRGRVNGTCY